MFLIGRYPWVMDHSIDKNNNNGLHLASVEGKMDTVVYLIDNLEMDPIIEGQYGRNCFLKACYGGHIEIVKYLAGRYPELNNSVDENNDNGLHLAAWQGKMDIVVFLIDHLGMDPTVEGIYGRNCFLKACYGEDIEIVNYLAGKYPELKNSVDENNDNGLHLAAWQGKMDIVVFLIDRLGMNPIIEGQYGQNCFLKACYGGHIEIVKYLAGRYPELKHSVDENNDNGLHLAVWQGKIDIVVFLIDELGMDPTFEGIYGRNGFLMACYGGHIGIVKYLAGKHPKLKNTVDEDKNNCLHLAAKKGDMQTVVFLIDELGMDPTVEGIDGRNCFIWACYSGIIETVKYLVGRYPKLKYTVDEDNNNGLHWAVLKGKLDTVVYLIDELGMDPTVEGIYGRNCFLMACYGGHIEIVKYLAGKYPKLKNTVDGDKNNGLHLAAWLGETDTVVYLIEELGMDPAVEGQYGQNGYLTSCSFGHIGVVKYLAERYSKLINTVDGYKNNGLHLAAKKGDMQTVVFLIDELGMAPTVEGINGRNCFIWACYSGIIETVKYLVGRYQSRQRQLLIVTI